jgi:hypothetical protein
VIGGGAASVSRLLARCLQKAKLNIDAEMKYSKAGPGLPFLVSMPSVTYILSRTDIDKSPNR